MDENKMQLISKIFNREDIEKNLSESVVTKVNKLNYKYIDEEKQIEVKDKDKKKLK